MTYQISPLAPDWTAGYQAARAGKACAPPATLQPLATRPLSQDPRITAALKAWRDGWQAGAEYLRRRGSVASIQAVPVIGERGGVTYRRWSAGQTVRGTRPELTANQIATMSAGQQDAYHSLLAVDVPIL